MKKKHADYSKIKDILEKEFKKLDTKNDPEFGTVCLLNAKKVDSLSQFIYHESITFEYLSFHLSFKLSSCASAISSVGAVYIFFRSATKTFLSL